MTSEEIKKLHIMQRALHIFANALLEVEHSQDDLNVRRKAAEQGKLLIPALTDLCSILEARAIAKEIPRKARNW